MPKRPAVEPEDSLRAEYLELLPRLSRLAEQVQTEIRFHTLPISLQLGEHEQLIVKARIKGCNSAIDKLRRKQEGGDFDRDSPDQYFLSSLNDLVAVRVLVFPRSRMHQVDEILRRQFSDWTPDHIRNKETDDLLAFKYFGLRPQISPDLRGEYQIVSMLTGLFWEVEHDALYKLEPSLKRIIGDKEMNRRTSDVYQALTAFEDGFERLLPQKNLL